MITIGTMYYKHEDYVKGSCDCNKTGYFAGNTANKLGLIGKEMTEDMYKNLREGLHPETGERLVALGPNGEHRDGWDVTCSMSKEESLLYAVGNEQEKRLVDDVQRESVHRFVLYVEKNIIQGRDGEGNAYRTGSVLAWVNDHHGNRMGEADRHTHIAIYNITKDENGSFKAVHSDGLLRREHLISVYENIKAQVWLEKGYAVEKYKAETGNSVYSKLAGVDEKAVEVTSIRTQQIDNYIKEYREELAEKYPDAGMGRLREIAALATRVAEKIDYTFEDVRNNTVTALKEAGIEPDSVVSGIYRAAEQQKTEFYKYIKLNEYDFLKIASEVLTKNESVFSKEQLLTVSCRLATGSEISVEKLQNTINELTKDKDFLHLQTVSEKSKGVVEYMTTKEMKNLEKDIAKEVRAGQGKFEAVMTKDEVKAHLTNEKYSHLTNDQKNAVEFSLTSKAEKIAIDGLAGVGKTTSNAVMKELFEAKGYQVHGLAPTGVAAEKLTEVGIKAQTIDSFLNPESNQNSIMNSKGHVFIVDEASMLGSQKFSELIDKIDAEYSNPLIILQGSKGQLSPVQAGNPFVYLQELNAVDTLKITETVRFKTDLTKSVSDAVSNKQINKVFSVIESKNNLHENQNRSELIKAVVEDYTSRNNLKDSVVIAATNHDRTEINNAIRDELKAQGRLTGEGYTFTTREVQNINPVSMHFAASYKKGDYLFNSYSTPGFKKGSEAKVIAIGHHKNNITVEKANGTTTGIDLTVYGSNFTLYRETQTEFCKNDRILFTKNDESIGVKNGSIGTVVKVDEDGYLKIRLDNNNKLTAFNVKDYGYMTYANCITTHKMQGGTVKEAIYYADTKNQSPNNYQAFNVAMTRAKENVSIYTNDVETLKEQVSTEQNKLNTVTLSDEVKDLAELQNKYKETQLSTDKEYREQPNEPKRDIGIEM